ncbi:hypothetical protein C2845_PM01G43980 [Panicum miliaceum]|uniref:Uncharacterized protein n=1 Tax=Panicum miliaceum TaxID=4540 RepID=A0A3L6TI74_PANMI|nr:hypothetical protein C2845_PM01G43980 [Panicum miliaceum]
MDGAGEDAERILMVAINHDSTAVYQHYGEEEARTIDSFLNMSGDSILEEDDDDDFVPMHEQPVRSDNPVGVKPYWEEFKEYKLSEEAREKSEKNIVNAALKKYNHHLRAGDIRIRFRNGRRWSMTSWIEVSG